MGDGYANLDAGEAGALDALIQGISQTAANSTFPLSASQLGGVNVWLLQHIADVASVAVTYDSVVLPAPLVAASNRSAQVAYLFGTLGYDCLVSATAVRSDMLPFADFLLPNEQYGLSVVTLLVPASSTPTASVLFSWTSPFSFEIWILIAVSLFFGSAVMYVFQGNDRQEDYGAADLPLLLRLGRGCYKAFLNFSAVGGFTPNTPASQTFNTAFAFAMLLLQATYTANLAAYFVGTRSPVSAVTGMASFGAKQLAACVLPDPYVLRLLRSNFPLTTLLVLPPTATTADLLDAVMNGTCAGGVASNLDLRYTMGPRDAAGDYCDLQLVGPLISQGSMAVPFNRATVPPAAMAALNAIAASAYALGDYASGASVASFADSRPFCSAAAGLSAGAPLAALTLVQVSGIFFVLLFGACVAGVVFLVFHWHARRADEGARAEGGGKGGEQAAHLVSREEAVSALCAAVAREAAAALQVPPRVAAAAERARAERGAALRATLQLVDVDGERYGRAHVAVLVHAPDWLFLLTRLTPDDALRFGTTIRALAAGAPSSGAGGADLAQPSGDPSADDARPRDPWAYFASVSGAGDAQRQQQRHALAPLPSFRTGFNNVAAFFRLPMPAPAAAKPTPSPSGLSIAPSEAPTEVPPAAAGQRSSRRAVSAVPPRAASTVGEARQSSSPLRGGRRSSSAGSVARGADDGAASPRRVSRRASEVRHAAPAAREEEEEEGAALQPHSSSFLANFRRSSSKAGRSSRIPHFKEDNV